MGLLKGVLKFVLSNLLILFLLLFVLTASFQSSLSPEYFKGQIKNFLKSQPEFSENIGKLYDESREHFFILGNNETIKPSSGEMPFDFEITKQQANLTKQEFEDIILEKFADFIYNTEQDTPLGKMSMANLGNKVSSYKTIAMILSIIFGLALFILFSGRWVLLGTNFLIVSVFYFPIKFTFSTLQKQVASKVPGEVAASFQNLLGGIFSSSLSVASRYFLFFFIGGVLFIAIGLLVKVLKLGLWFQSFFEKKK